MAKMKSTREAILFLSIRSRNLYEFSGKTPGGPKYAGESVEVYENKRAKKADLGVSVEVDEK